MRIETERLLITEFDLSMAESVHKNSLDEENRKFVPDEVFETVEEAKETIEFLMSVYETEDGPLVYPVLLKNGTNIGHVQLVPITDGFEVGYHIGKEYTKNGYATEAVKAMIPDLFSRGFEAVTAGALAENAASLRVMQKCGMQLQEFTEDIEYRGTTHKCIYYAIRREK